MISNSEIFIQERELELMQERDAEKKAVHVELEYLRDRAVKPKESKPENVIV